MSADGGLFMLILLVVAEVKTIVDLLDGEVGAAQKRSNRAEQDMIPSAIRLLLLDGLVKAVVEIMTAC
jgi:hypothetical protein